MKRSLLSLLALAGILAMPVSLLAQDDSAAKVAAAAAQKNSAVTVLTLIESGGWAMVPLAFMSVLTVMLIVAYAITLRRGAVVSANFMHTAEELLKRRDYPGLLAISNRHSESIARVVHRTLDFAAKHPSTSFEVVREIAQTEGATQAASLQHRITYLADIAVLSPMVGLLGTVFGIIRSFGVLASATSQASRPMLLAAGVSEALVATAAGLIIGVVSMAFYGIFRNKVQSLISDLERASALVLGLMALQFDRSEPKREERRESYREPAREPAPPRRPAVSVDDEF
ncbi:MAG: MotA/TolQ/ExbB proton channel family protein [Verrucomicrobiota bacterium]